MDYADYEEYPKTLARDDFWGQVRRTIYGRRITEEELSVVVAGIKDGLALCSDDALLDLMCGNGALTARVFDSCQSVVGVDRSSYLIEIAKEYFERPPRYVFVNDDVVTYVRRSARTHRFTKALCYGSFQYLPVEGAETVLTTLRAEVPTLERIVLGNLPDRERAHLFFGERWESERPDLGDPGSQIGVWWAQADMSELARRCGWKATFSKLPTHVFNAHYRHDAILEREGA